MNALDTFEKLATDSKNIISGKKNVHTKNDLALLEFVYSLHQRIIQMNTEKFK